MIFNGSLMSHIGNLGCACSHVSKKRQWGGFIGAGALNRANTVFPVMVLRAEFGFRLFQFLVITYMHLLLLPFVPHKIICCVHLANLFFLFSLMSLSRLFHS